jgi:Ca2+-binding EF-hand superfamily protein
MISLTTEYKLASLLQSLSNGEKDIEISRQVLAERTAFEPYTAFKRISRNSTSALSAYQIIDFLRENEFAVLEKDVRNVIRLYSNTGRLSYTEFLEVILPRNNSVLRELCTQRESYYVAEDEILPYEVELGLAKILDKEVNLSRKIELLKEDLVARFDFSLRGAYEAIADAGEGRADFDGIYNFLQKNGISIIEKDIVALLRRIDADKDGRLTFGEFSDAILPRDEYYRRIGETAIRTRPSHRTSTPLRNTGKISRNTATSPSKKLTNSDYFDYLDESARKSLRRSLSPLRSASLRESAILKTPTRTRNVASPLRSRSPGRAEKLSPLKEFEEEQLAKALRENIELDKELEQAKNKLALQEDFNLFDAFRFFDLTEKGFITRLELRESINDFEVFPSTNELGLIMKKYNKDDDGLLKYSEFCEILKPKDAGYASILTGRKPSYVEREELSDLFSRYTIELVRKVLNKIIENEYHSEQLRQKLARRPQFDAFDAFETLDKNKNGSITKYEFKEFLAEHGFYATTKELQTLMSRYDRNEDGKVSYTEFVKEIRPKSP